MRTKIIAEIGTLHHSEGLEWNLAVVKQCFEAGADMVKTQMINPRTAYWAGEKAMARYRDHERAGWGYTGLAQGRWHNFFDQANKIGPTFASIFDEVFMAGDMDDFVPAWKVGYKGIFLPRVLQAMCGVRNPVIISLTSEDEALRVLPVPLLCQPRLFVQPEYPTRNIVIPVDGGFSGYSIHHKNWIVMDAVFALQPKYVELHVMGPGAVGPDTEFALTIEQLRFVCNYTRNGTRSTDSDAISASS